MKIIAKFLVLGLALLNCLCILNPIDTQKIASNEESIIDISQEVVGNANYKKGEFKYLKQETTKYFKYENSTLPSSKISAFRFIFDVYSENMKDFSVRCVNVDTSTTDSELVTILSNLEFAQSSCVEGFKNNGYYDGIVRLNETKTKLGIMISFRNGFDYEFGGRIMVRITERVLGTGETKPMEEETYSLVPFTVNVASFRELSKSKILFYSNTRSLQMFHTETNNPYPEKLFSGRILTVYINPNMVRQKYFGANIMTLVTNPSGFNSGSNPKNEDFLFEVTLFESNYLLDYYVSSNSGGRPVNSPLLINMTECTNPYYVILNYNREETAKTLVIDQIYGQLSYLSVATDFTQNTWSEMLNKDMTLVDIKTRKHNLPNNSTAHIDVYKIECFLPLMMNFYYIDEAALISKMNYGDVNIFTIKPYETIQVLFFQDLRSPQVIIEIFNPVNDPTIIVEAQGETVYQKNTLIKIIPMSLDEGIKIKERGGISDTRIIIKVGYPEAGWSAIDEYMKYNQELKLYMFTFPNDISKYNYTLANLITSGSNPSDNVKYCFTTNIGAPLKPSSENCYRVSKDNPYTLKAYNPLIMYKDYDYDDTLSYYITFSPVTEVSYFNVLAEVEKYDTTIRNYEGINNKIVIDDTNDYSSILTPPKNRDPAIFIQVHVCDNEHSIKTKVIMPLTKEEIISERTIEKGTKNNYMSFKNINVDTEFFVIGEKDVNVFVRMVGLPIILTPEFNDNYKISFDISTNTLNVESPLTQLQSMRYTVIVGRQGEISKLKLTLCSFVDIDISKITEYSKTVVSNTKVTSIQLNFDVPKIKPGEKFEAIVYTEQVARNQMVFLSDIYEDTVGEIDIETIHELDEVYSSDNSYMFKSVEASATQTSYYFTYLPEEVLEVPIGAFGIELDDSSSGSFTGVACTFVDNGTDAMSMIEAIEEAIEKDTSYCIGSQSTLNPKRYNYIFKYENKDSSTPKRLVIKVSNEESVKGKFTVYMKRDQGVTIERTDFYESKEYGANEEAKKSVIPYIVDVYTLRGDSETDYVSKVLFYSQHLEMQMYYIPKDSNAPIKLFCGNIALVYTKPDLAMQKYHATTLVLISENLEGQEHGSIGGSFRFHTKMFKSDAQIEFFVSQNPDGRTLNFPLSLEMNTCTKDNNKLYYIVNYNKPETTRTLHLDMIFGSFANARIAKEINADKWDSLIQNSMTNIENYKAELPEKPQHIEVIEIECKSPLLLNAYYSYDEYSYNNVKEGEIVVKELPAQDSFSFTVEKGSSSLFYYSMTLFNPIDTPDVTVQFSKGDEHYIKENSLQTGMLLYIPDRITVISNCKSKTRFIFKIGFGVEEWEEVEKEQIKYGKIYQKKNHLVYKFPSENNMKNFTKVNLLINSVKAEVENVKFCYSTNLGIAIEPSRENCFRTGVNIPYTLTFINPLIVGKNYRADTVQYYISIRPFEEDDYVNIKVTEETYDTTLRNDIGFHKMLTLSQGKINTILSLPNQQEEDSKILLQLKSCKNSGNPTNYNIYNAYSKEKIEEGIIYNKDGYGIYFISQNALLEHQLELVGDAGTKIFSKHAEITGDYSPVISEYKATFDSSTNVVSIIKPIYGEVFTVTVLVGRAGSLFGLTQCDLAIDDRSHLADYVYTFDSISSNIITHFIDFASIQYSEGTEFDLLVYAEQMYASQMEFLYPVITGKVGKITAEVEQINEYIGEKNEYVTKSFNYKIESNYLYYDFVRKPTGNIASLKIKSSGAKVTRIGCVFTSNLATNDEMISAINKAALDGTNVCIGTMRSSAYDALINANYTDGNNRLVIQVLYGLGEEKKNDGEDTNIVIKISGTKLDISERKYAEDETLSMIPYVIDLLDIRDKQADYISKILFYSNTREMEMLYIDKDSAAPVSLFTGNILLVYTNPELVRQKYHNATIMILITDALYASEKHPVGEQYRFMIKLFDSASQIQYFLSSNENGRPLNNPTTIEMTSCTQPYYYIMNYNKLEGSRMLHIDTIFGERESIKVATVLNKPDWDSLIDQMEAFDGDEIELEEQNTFHFDVIEVKCKLPVLLNLFYIDPNEVKTSNLELGDIVILSLAKGKEQSLTFLTGGTGPFVYSFNVLKENNEKPNIEILFYYSDKQDSLNITENGVYPQYYLYEVERIVVVNKDTDSHNTRIIFKFGYVVEFHFQKIQNEVYSNQNDKDRTINLFGYIYDQTKTKLNYTGIDFEVTTTEDNVKFCYSTNLGTFINPSLQNCYRVGKLNSYTISTLNPLVMYRNYFSEENLNYYVGFRTVDLNQNITIIPKLKKYDTDIRNFEGFKNKITTTEKDEDSIILTAPAKHDDFIFVHIHICSKDRSLSYKYYNAYNSSSLGYNGEIQANTKNQFISISNPLLDTELKISAEKGTNIFVKHVGIPKKHQPIVRDIQIWYDNTTHVLNWTQPITNEEFVYNIVIDKRYVIYNKEYTLCSLLEIQKLGYYTHSITSNSDNPNIIVPDFGSDFEIFDILIVAEETDQGKLTIMSDVYDSTGRKYEPNPSPTPSPDSGSSSNVGLVVVIVILSVVLIGGTIFTVILYIKYKNKGDIKAQGKATSLALITGTEGNKLVESQANEVSQIDP